MRVPLRSFLPKWCHHISVEPALIFYFSTEIILEFANNNLYLQKACRNNATSEIHLDTPCDDEKRGILFVSTVESSSKYVLFSLRILYLVAASRWSDEAGKKRKPLILLPMISQLMQTSFCCLHTYFWYWNPVFAVLSNVFFQLIFGGYPICLNISAAYLNDLSSTDDRTMRIGLLFALETLCMLIGNGAAGWMLRKLGFLNTYFVCLGSGGVALVLGWAFIKDKSIPVERRPSIFGALNPTCVVDAFKIMFQKRLGRKIVVFGI